MKNVIPEVLVSMPAAVECLAPDVEGQTSPKVRWLLNALVKHLPRAEAYCEVGLNQGATLISALLDSPVVASYGCDNWSEYPSREVFETNLNKYKARLPEVTVFSEDCFEMARRCPFHLPIGVLFYDGDHSAVAHRAAFVEFGPALANQAIVVVDDWNWPAVRNGSWVGLSALRPKKLDFCELPARHNFDVENFHNGIGLFYIER